MTCFFGLANSFQIKMMVNRFFPNEDPKKKEELASQIPVEARTMAELQGFLLNYREDIDKATRVAKKYFEGLALHPPRKSTISTLLD